MTGSNIPAKEIYREILLKQNQGRQEIAERCFDAAFQYGMFCVKNLFLVSSAGILALPGLAGFADVKMTNVIYAGVCFVFGLAASLISAYLNNINSLLNKKYATDLRIYEIDAGAVDEFSAERKSYEAAQNWHDKIVKVTFYSPHVFGVLSASMFLVGCWLALFESR